MEIDHIITSEESGERIDVLLVSLLGELATRSSVQKLIEAEKVLVNGNRVKKNYRCCESDSIHVEEQEVSDVEIIPQDLPLDIVYEDNDVIVVNKERGMVVHPAAGHPDGTLVNALLYYCGDSLSGIGGEKRPGIVHRIDKDTSGLIVVAKNDFAHQGLAAQLADHSLSRVYHCIAIGNLKEDKGKIDAPIGRSLQDRKKMAVTEKNSKNAVTYWEVIKRFRGYTYAKCILETGRTHQIRVHMKSIGHPLLGDFTYGAKSPDKGLEGQCLHAKEITFMHPRTGERVHIETELPEYFKNVLAKMGTEM